MSLTAHIRKLAWLTVLVGTHLGCLLAGLFGGFLGCIADSHAQSSREMESRQMGSRQAVSRQAISRAFASEPAVAEVRQAALRASGYDAGDLDRWSSRARWSHLLPEVQGEVAWLDQRDKESRYREDIDTNDQGQMLRDSARNDFIDDTRLRTVYAVELEWDLSGLVYDRSEPTIAREVRSRRKARVELLVEVGEAYYLRRRYMMELMLTPSAKWRKRMELRLEADRQTARLDAMTAGWFSRALAKGRISKRQEAARQ